LDEENESQRQQQQPGAENSMVQNDEFFNLIMKSQQSRLEDQRTSMNTSKIHKSLSKKSTTSTSLTTDTSSSQSYNKNNNQANKVQIQQPERPIVPVQVRPCVTVPPDDAFFSMIQKIQSRRLDEQRSSIKNTIKAKFTSLKTSNSGSNVLKKAYDR
jgi:hypothetical protein